MRKEDIAKVAHEVNTAYCESLGDFSQLAWEDAPDWQKKSAILGVQAHLANSSMSPEESHDAWLREKKEDGWKYGEVKNPKKKEHPCFMPFEDLPQDQRSKDYIFGAVVRVLKDL